MFIVIIIKIRKKPKQPTCKTTTVVTNASVGVLQDNLVLSTRLIMWVGHHKEIQKLTFRALALQQSGKGLMLKTSASKSLYSGQLTLLLFPVDRDTYKIFYRLQSNVFDAASLFQTNNMVHWNAPREDIFSVVSWLFRIMWCSFTTCLSSRGKFFLEINTLWMNIM